MLRFAAPRDPADLPDERAPDETGRQEDRRDQEPQKNLQEALDLAPWFTPDT